MRWLHLSDIHFGFKGYDSNNVREKLVEKIKKLNLQMDFILITGDCLYKFGKESWDQKSIIKYIKDIAKACKCPNKRVYICPGNHDVDRENESRNNLIQSIRDGNIEFGISYRELFDYGHDRFQIIYKGVTSSDFEAYKVFAPKKALYRIVSIDTCLLSKDKEDCYKIKIFNEKIKEIEKDIKKDGKVNILIMHHGIECFELSEAKKFEHWVEDKGIDVIFCGHTHRAAVNSYDDLEHDIKQFTAGAIIVDDYAVPGFYICERNEEDDKIEMSLYTYSKETENWGVSNEFLRKFKNGKYIYELYRHKRCENNESSLEKRKSIALRFDAAINEFSMKYFWKYESDKIYTNKDQDLEKFDFWKIVHSLVDVGASYLDALNLTCQVIEKISSPEFKTNKDILSSEELKDIIYDAIIHFHPSQTESEFDVSCWASRYARKYSRDKEILVTNKYGNQEKLTYYYIKNTLLKNVIDYVTNNKIFYEKIFRNELTRMAESVLEFLKNMSIFEIREEALIELVKEYVTQKPHPWLVNKNREQLIIYHKEQSTKHIDALKNEEEQTVITQMEAAYHICAALLARYDDYIGCTETSPIIILEKALNNISNKEQNGKMILPIQKFQIIQMKKDLEYHDVRFAQLVRNINILKKNIVVARKISLRETKTALLELWDILLKLEQPVCNSCSLKIKEERVRDIFISAKGFVVKANLRDLSNCFWVEPNWEEYEIRQQHLGKQILICVLENVIETERVCQYLYMQNRRETITEIVFVLNDYSAFSSEDRKQIRNMFKGRYVRCIFIQEENFAQISEKQGWREVFYRILEISKIS